MIEKCSLKSDTFPLIASQGSAILYRLESSLRDENTIERLVASREHLPCFRRVKSTLGKGTHVIELLGNAVIEGKLRTLILTVRVNE